MNQIIIMGDSHMGAPLRAFKAGGFISNTDINFISVRREKYQPILENNNALSPRFAIEKVESLKINPLLAEDINKAIDKNKKNHLIAMISGNHHSIMSMCPAPDPMQRFDFILPKHKNLPNQPDTAIVPYTQVKTMLKRKMTTRNIGPLLALKNILPDVSIYCVAPPPPIPSSEHIQQNMGRFQDRIKEHGISPAPFRLKFWLLQLEISQEVCQQNGIHFLPIPEGTQDNEGFLREEFWNQDPTHANSLYGKLVLDQIKLIIGE